MRRRNSDLTRGPQAGRVDAIQGPNAKELNDDDLTFGFGPLPLTDES
jgi:hypothetical protein